MREITYRTTSNESTRCNLRKNNCLCKFIDIKKGAVPVAEVTPAARIWFHGKMPKAATSSG